MVVHRTCRLQETWAERRVRKSCRADGPNTAFSCACEVPSACTLGPRKAIRTCKGGHTQTWQRSIKGVDRQDLVRPRRPDTICGPAAGVRDLRPRLFVDLGFCFGRVIFETGPTSTAPELHVAREVGAAAAGGGGGGPRLAREHPRPRPTATSSVGAASTRGPRLDSDRLGSEGRGTRFGGLFLGRPIVRRAGEEHARHEEHGERVGTHQRLTGPRQTPKGSDGQFLAAAKERPTRAPVKAAMATRTDQLDDT